MLRSGRARSVSAARQAGQAKPAQCLRRTAKMCPTTTSKRPELFAVDTDRVRGIGFRVKGKLKMEIRVNMELSCVFYYSSHPPSGEILVLGPVSDAVAQSESGRPPRSGWYIGGGIGPNWGIRHGPGGLEPGDNLLSDEHLFRCGPRSRSLRIPVALRYRLSRRGRIRDHSRTHFRLPHVWNYSFAQRKNGLNQMFRSITDYDGMPHGRKERRHGS